MTTEEAMALTARHTDVTIKRRHGTWTGRVIGVITQPAVIVEEANGSRTAIVLDEAEVVALVEGTERQ